jgi:hypothetical protein
LTGGTWQYGFWNAKGRSYYTVNSCHGSTVVLNGSQQRSANTVSGAKSIAENSAVNYWGAGNAYYYRTGSADLAMTVPGRLARRWGTVVCRCAKPRHIALRARIGVPPAIERKVVAQEDSRRCLGLAVRFAGSSGDFARGHA